jgi:hypothetical protein
MFAAGVVVGEPIRPQLANRCNLVISDALSSVSWVRWKDTEFLGGADISRPARPAAHECDRAVKLLSQRPLPANCQAANGAPRWFSLGDFRSDSSRDCKPMADRPLWRDGRVMRGPPCPLRLA